MNLSRVIIALMTCTWSVASAAPVFVGKGEFSGATNVANFLSFPHGTLISSQLATPENFGLTFSSALGGIHANSDFSGLSGVAVSASSFAPGACPCVTVLLSFSTPVTRVAFDRFWSNGGTAEFAVNGISIFTTVGQFPDAQFIAIEDLAGINSINVIAPVNQAFHVDVIWMDGTAIPEPGTFGLLALGLAAALAGKRLRNR